MQSGGINAFLKSRGIDRGSLISQVTASVVWAKLVRRLAAQNTEISDEEVDDALKRLKEHAGEPQSRVAEIFLAVDNPGQDAEVRSLMEKLIDQMKHGARFSAIAQQFSQSATAAVGGDIGWIRPDQLPSELARAVTPLKPGELSPPIRRSRISPHYTAPRRQSGQAPAITSCLSSIAATAQPAAASNNRPGRLTTSCRWSCHCRRNRARRQNAPR
jgi:hypothetical protein